MALKSKALLGAYRADKPGLIPAVREECQPGDKSMGGTDPAHTASRLPVGENATWFTVICVLSASSRKQQLELSSSTTVLSVVPSAMRCEARRVSRNWTQNKLTLAEASAHVKPPL